MALFVSRAFNYDVLQIAKQLHSHKKPLKIESSEYNTALVISSSYRCMSLGSRNVIDNLPVDSLGHLLQPHKIQTTE